MELVYYNIIVLLFSRGPSVVNGTESISVKPNFTNGLQLALTFPVLVEGFMFRKFTSFPQNLRNIINPARITLYGNLTFIVHCSLISLQVQSIVQRLPIVCLSHKLRVQGKQLLNKEAKSVTNVAMRERNWTDVTVGEECVVQVELTRRCLKGRVRKMGLLK